MFDLEPSGYFHGLTPFGMGLAICMQSLAHNVKSNSILFITRLNYFDNKKSVSDNLKLCYNMKGSILCQSVAKNMMGLYSMLSQRVEISSGWLVYAYISVHRGKYLNHNPHISRLKIDFLTVLDLWRR